MLGQEPVAEGGDRLAYGGTLPVKFNFDTGAVEVTATVSAPTLASGQVDREN